MTGSFASIFFWLLLGIALIVLLTAKWRVHAFFALLAACFVVGIGVGIPVEQVIATSKEGFGNILKSLGLIIVLGTTLGVLLEFTNSTRVMASFILRITGEKYAGMAMGITGFVVGLPIFCDSGYIVLSGLNNSLAKRTGKPLAMLSVSLATGLYSVHCLIPPHPGAAAAAGVIGVDFGRLILWGLVVAVPASMVGHLWASFAGKNIATSVKDNKNNEVVESQQPPVVKAFLPVILPVLLIAAKSFLGMENAKPAGWLKGLLLLGDPVIALAIGCLLAFACRRHWDHTSISAVLKDAAEKAGGILVIIGAGGAFGAVLAATKIGEQFSHSQALENIGILFPFLLTFVLKTAQGSSTVAIVTAASILQPLLPSLGLATATGQLICVLSMGAGSMMISHANDAYFWVIAKFSGLEMKTMLKVYSVATLLMGLTSLALVYLLSMFL